MLHDSMRTGPAEHRCDVLVIGGGPAGSTTATLLAEKGHRVTHSTMRKLFMSPRNDFRVRDALMSVLAFKAVYDLASLANLKRTVTAWQRHKINVRPQEDAGCR